MMAAPTHFEQLSAIKTALAGVTGVNTCQIGIEANITADAYPIIRIVPSALRQSDGRRDTEIDLLVYYGELSHPFEEGGIEAQYEWLLGMERAVRNAILTAPGCFPVWQESILDEDRIPGYKLFASRFIVR